jgi:hypothetical protein
MKLEYKSLSDEVNNAQWQSTCLMKINIKNAIDTLMKEQQINAK